MKKAWGVLCLLVAGGLLGLDDWIRQALLPYRTPVSLAVMGGITLLGDSAILLILFGLLWAAAAWFKEDRRRTIARTLFCAILTSRVAVEGFKRLAGRPRPALSDAGMRDWGPSFDPERDAFPSGHATTAFTAAWVLSACYPRWRGPLYGAAVCVALSRVWLDRHFFSDVAAGAMLGMGVGWLFLKLGTIQNQEKPGISLKGGGS
jgi:membrane-associated phospholipid phosphatase